MTCVSGLLQIMEEAGNLWQFVFYGDATVEALRGTSVNSSTSHLDEAARFWNTYLQSLKAGWFGITGECSP